MAFPNNVLQLAHAASTNFLSAWFGGTTPHSTGDNLMIDHIIAAEKKIGTGSGAAATAPVRCQALIGSGVADSDGNQGSVWDRTTRKNMLVNGTGRTRQRVAFPTADNAYGFDRWRLLMENASGAVLSQEVSDLPVPGPGSAMRLTVGAGNNGKFGHWQPILFADCRDVAGGVVSLQAKLKASHAREANTRMAVMQFTGTADAISGDPITTWGADGTNPTPSTNWSFANTPASLAITTAWLPYYLENIAISASAVDLAVLVWCDARTTTAADFIEMTDVQLEQGAVCTAVERITGGEELLACQHWLNVLGKDAAFQTLGAGAVHTSTIAEFHVPLPRRMRTVPTVTYGTATDFDVVAAAGTTTTTAIANGSFAVNSAEALCVRATVASGLTAGHGCTLRNRSATTGIITASSEP